MRNERVAKADTWQATKALEPVQKAIEPQRHTKGEDTKGHEETRRHTKSLCGTCPFWFVGKMKPDKAEKPDEIG
jgi:hypothetical protein